MAANPAPNVPTVRSAEQEGPHEGAPVRPVTRATAPAPCPDCRADNAFQRFVDQDIGPAFNSGLKLSLPEGKRVVIELVTASIQVPQGEMARLRMFAGIGNPPGNFDLVLTPQGQVGGQIILVATHSLRAYAQGQSLEFSINRDNGQTKGHALVCISGYTVD